MEKLRRRGGRRWRILRKLLRSTRPISSTTRSNRSTNSRAVSSSARGPTLHLSPPPSPLPRVPPPIRLRPSALSPPLLLSHGWSQLDVTSFSSFHSLRMIPTISFTIPYTSSSRLLHPPPFPPSSHPSALARTRNPLAFARRVTSKSHLFDSPSHHTST
ncbi:hypothetical protein BCR35DRAFT_348909 [Leucosporidium creatinivorum]|uniref:Uncharacterized protein n=1 Tax=Leucosporidium creatinivorum TaxID=106004 RepID=A0A1Y2G3K8_9BASI|nr:hypothetical protein BCR35DRAFT_348909 [Leucosporidium creatinivorum]